MSINRIAVIASAIWVLAVGAYGVGYLAQLETGAGSRALPTLDFMLFVFAVVGPLAMLWIVVVLLNRTAELSDSIVAQGESALVLAESVANLNASIDELSDGTRGRLSTALDRMDRHAAASTKAFEENLAETSSRLNRVLLESIVTIDERIAGRVEAFEAALEAQRENLDQLLREDSARVSAALEGQRAALDRRLNDNTTRLTAAIETELSSLADLRVGLMDHVRSGLAESKARLDHGISETLAHQQTAVSDANRRLHAALEGFTNTLAQVQSKHTKLFDSDIGAPIRDLAKKIDETRRTLAAQPPATADALADMLGKTAQHLLRDDRKAAEGLLARLETLEETATDMLARIDRTSRLNPLMDSALGETAPIASDDEAAELPFAALPRSAARMAVNWAAAVRALRGEAERPGAPQLVTQASSDADIALVLELSGRVADALSEDKVHLEDLALDHAPAGLWHRYGTGERGGEITALGEVSDDIMLALVRARLRGDAEFRALAIRFADAHGRLIERASAELGADPKLVEIADTRPGRAFMLLGGMIGAFAANPRLEEQAS